MRFLRADITIRMMYNLVARLKPEGIIFSRPASDKLNKTDCSCCVQPCSDADAA